MITNNLKHLLQRGGQMTSMTKLLCLALVGTALSHAALAKNSDSTPRPVVKDDVRATDICLPALDNRVHRFGKVWINLTNAGWFGNSEPTSSEAVDDPEYPGVWAPQCEYPGGSGQQYLYQGSIWVGALIVDDTGLETPRVSFGSEGWERDCNELWPTCSEDAKIQETSTRKNAISRITNESIYDSLSVSEQDFKAVYADTLENYPSVMPGYVYDGEDRDHVALGVEIEQVSHSWSYSYAQDFVIVDFQITNIGSKFLKNLFVGLYMDADIGHKDESEHHTDDFCGFRPFAEDTVTGQRVQINAAYIADNDGRPHDEVIGTNFTCPHVVGTRVLRAPNPMLTTTFNWWNSNSSASQDYGPCWEYWGEHPEALVGGSNMTWCNEYGTPLADVHKYQVMANGEFDPDMFTVDPDDPPEAQIYDGQERSWLMPGPDESVKVGGDDTRYLLSWGPLGVYDYTDAQGVNVYRLNPGESFVMTLAIVAGENLHDRSNPQTEITDDLADSRIDDTRFEWTDFDFNAIWAQRVYDNEMYDTPIYDLDGDGFYETGDGFGGEDVGLDGLWAQNIGDTVRYFGTTVMLPDGNPAVYNGPDLDGTEGNGLIDSSFSELWGYVINEDDFLWEFMNSLGVTEMREDSFLIYAGPKFSKKGFDVDDWYVGHFNGNGFLDLGDGIPDFQGPPPPPCPDLSIETGTDFVELVWTRNSMDEDYLDPFSHVQDFEGFRVWVSNTSMDNEYSLLAQFDNVNYAYFDAENALRTLPDFGPLDALPLREPDKGWERQPVGMNSGFADIAYAVGAPDEEILFDANGDLWVSAGTGYNDQINAINSAIAVRDIDGSYTYFIASGEQVYMQGGNENDPASGTMYTEENGTGLLVLGERFLDESDQNGDYNNLWDAGDYTVQFRYVIEEVHSLFPRYYSATAYDFGDYQTGTEPLETAQSCNSLRQAPSGVPGRKVMVVPNPYRVDVDYQDPYEFKNSPQGLQWENQDDGTLEWYPQQDRRIEFMNLPETCLIRIYTVSGDLVQVLPHNMDGDRSRWDSQFSEGWDLNTRNFQQVCSGLYLFSVEDKSSENEGDVSTGKFVIIK
jgi:hypothetical protein